MNQHWVLVVYLDLLQPACSFLWSINNPINCVFISLTYIFYSTVILVSFFTGWSKKFWTLIIILCDFLFQSQEENILCTLFWPHYLQTIKQNVCWPKKLGSIKWSKYWFCAYLVVLILSTNILNLEFWILIIPLVSYYIQSTEFKLGSKPLYLLLGMFHLLNW